jgi:tocopherol O-methyltransferase
VQAAQIKPGSKILDAGCGFGGSSIYLAENYGADVMGITISPVQIELATQAAARKSVNARFLLMDAQTMDFDEPFDVIWSVESISHYQDRSRFFATAAKLLKRDGTVAIIDWFKKERLDQRTEKKFLHPIQKGMLVELKTMDEYKSMMRTSGLEITQAEVLNENVSKTWDLCLDIIKNKKLWELAIARGAEFVHFLQAFRAMRAGFRSGNFVYGLIVATKV